MIHQRGEYYNNEKNLINHPSISENISEPQFSKTKADNDHSSNMFNYS